jgi:hypothetical protein
MMPPVPSDAVRSSRSLPMVCRIAALLLLCCGVLSATAADRKTARLIKVLPHYLDSEGRHSVNPSLFDRDVYQFELRHDPERRSGLRFDVLWRTWSPGKGDQTPLTLKIELRGSRAPAQDPIVIDTPVKRGRRYSQWTKVRLPDESYQALGELVAWRVTLWRDDQLLAEQKSFLW